MKRPVRMPPFARMLSIAVTASGAALLGACGIDQGGVQAPDPPPATSSGNGRPTTVVSGPITGFGSVLVNGLTLDTGTAQILIDGRFATEADLDAGQIVRAVAVADTVPDTVANPVTDTGRLRAVSIEHEENVAGPIDAVDAPGGTLSVLEQLVIVDAGTRFGGAAAGIADLQAGQSIVVSGLTLPSGALLATHVRPARADETAQITARVTNVDIGNLRFELGGLTIDYSQAVLLQFPEGTPELGLVVEARGTTLANGMLVADEVRVRASLPGLFTAASASLTDFELPLVGAASGSNAIDASFVGYITAVGPPGSISLVDVEVEIDKGTQIEGGAVNDLVVGTKVLVEGGVTGFGRVQASRIEVF